MEGHFGDVPHAIIFDQSDEIATVVNRYFTQIGKTLVNNLEIDEAGEQVSCPVDNASEIIDISLVTQDYVLKEINSMSTPKQLD